jgi:hypothetical protein
MERDVCKHAMDEAMESGELVIPTLIQEREAQRVLDKQPLGHKRKPGRPKKLKGGALSLDTGAGKPTKKNKQLDGRRAGGLAGYPAGHAGVSGPHVKRSNVGSGAHDGSLSLSGYTAPSGGGARPQERLRRNGESIVDTVAKKKAVRKLWRIAHAPGFTTLTHPRPHIGWG